MYDNVADDDAEDGDVEDDEVQDNDVDVDVVDDGDDDDDEDDDDDDDDAEDGNNAADDVEDDEVQDDDVEDDVEDEVEGDDVEKEEDDDVADGNVEEDDEKDDNVAEDEVEDNDVAENEVEDDNVEGDGVKGEEDDDVENDDVEEEEEEEDDDVEDDDVEEEDRSKDRDPQFAQACAIEMHMDMSQEPFYARIYKKNAVPQTCAARFVRAQMHMDMSKKPFYEGKCRTPEVRRAFCASLRNRNEHGLVARTFLCGNIQIKATDQDSDPHFARACGVEMHMDMSHEPFHAEIYIQGKCRTPELAPRSSTGLLLSQEPLSEDMGKNPSSSKLNSLPLLSLLLLMMAVMGAGPKAFKNWLNTAKLTRLTTEKIQHHKDKQPSSIYTHVYELKTTKKWHTKKNTNLKKTP